jgi:hypothetical protein
VVDEEAAAAHNPARPPEFHAAGDLLRLAKRALAAG